MSDDRPTADDDPADLSSPGGQTTAGGRYQRGRDRIEVAVERARRTAETLRDEIPAVDAGWESLVRDLDVGGPLITGAVAFRMFLWLLPATLVAVVGFGLFADTTGGSPEGVAKSAGIKGFAAQSIVSATKSSTEGRWLLVAVGIMALLSATRSLVKALWRSHELAWRVPKRSSPKTITSVAVAICLAVACFAVSAGVSLVREQSAALAIVAIALLLLGWFGLWLLISRLLPHGDAPLTALIPGAVLVALCIEALRVVTIYYIAGKINSSSSVYGGLGTAAALMTWFYLLAHVVVAAAVVNATLWERRRRGASDAPRRRSTASGTP